MIVPCNGCTLCCVNDAIRLLPADRFRVYKTEPHEHFRGELMLAHKPNGECVYLGEYGCIIQDRKPQMCREMDCRRVAKGITKKQAKQNGILRIWNKGRSMI